MIQTIKSDSFIQLQLQYESTELSTANPHAYIYGITYFGICSIRISRESLARLMELRRDFVEAA
jgi:hypothetical protein